MDIGRAFSFVFDDEEWIKKILVGGLLSLIPFVGSFIVYGYLLEIVSRVTSDAEESMPQWDDIGGYLARCSSSERSSATSDRLAQCRF